MFQTTLFLLAWYSLTTTLFQAVQSDMFLVDCQLFLVNRPSTRRDQGLYKLYKLSTKLNEPLFGQICKIVIS